MKHKLFQILTCFLALNLLLSGTGCSYAIRGCSAASCSSVIPEEMKEQFADTLDELSSMAQQGKQPAPEPYQKKPGQSAANNAFLSLDRELFTWYVTRDIITFDQFCYDPLNYGIDESSVPITLGELTEESRQNWITECRNWLTRLKTLDAEHLGEQNRLAYETYVRYLESEIAFDGMFFYFEPLEQYTGIQITLPITFALYQFRDTSDIEKYFLLLADVPRYLSQVLAMEQKRAELGLFMTDSMLDSVLEDINRILSSGSSNCLYTTFREALSRLDFISETQKSDYIEKNDRIISDSYLDSFRVLKEGLSELRPYCRGMNGIVSDDVQFLHYFSLRFQTESGSRLTVQEGIDQLDDLSKILYGVLKETYRKSSGKEQSFSLDTIQGNERYLRSIMTDIVPAMPNVSISYRNVPEELQQSFGPAAYLIPASDGYMDNTILVNPSVQTDLFTLAHEGLPGHMYQYSYHYSLGSIPLFQMVVEPLGYAEGWAKNAEYCVAKRADMFGTADSCSKVLNQILVYVISARCSLLVNGNGVSKQTITDYLEEWGLQEHVDEIYKLSVNMPFYYFKYAMGFSQQYAITEKCREIYAFRDKDYYTEYLSWGPTTFDLLEPKLIAWARLNAPDS